MGLGPKKIICFLIGKAYAKTCCFRTKAILKSCPIMKIHLLSNNCCPIYHHTWKFYVMNVFSNIEILVEVFAIGTFIVVQFLVASFVIGKVLVPKVSYISYNWGSFLSICWKIDSKNFKLFLFVPINCKFHLMWRIPYLWMSQFMVPCSF